MWHDHLYGDKKTFKRNTEFNTGGIIAPSNVHTKSSLEPSGDTHIQVDGIWSLKHVEFLHPITPLPKKVQHPIQIYN